MRNYERVSAPAYIRRRIRQLRRGGGGAQLMLMLMTRGGRQPRTHQLAHTLAKHAPMNLAGLQLATGATVRMAWPEVSGGHEIKRRAPRQNLPGPNMIN